MIWLFPFLYAMVGYILAEAGSRAGAKIHVKSTPAAFISVFLLWPYFAILAMVSLWRKKK